MTKFSDRDAGDFNEAAGERENEMAPRLPRDAGDLVRLRKQYKKAVLSQR